MADDKLELKPPLSKEEGGLIFLPTSTDLLFIKGYPLNRMKSQLY
ncbi:hypothetical protein [Bacillus sp. ISL-45]|nr:hypothetical protein [Bacillus sp. ISL-45]